MNLELLKNLCVTNKENRQDILINEFFSIYDNGKVYRCISDILIFEYKVFEDNIISDKIKFNVIVTKVLIKLFGIYLTEIFGNPGQQNDVEQFKDITKQLFNTSYKSNNDLWMISPMATVKLFFNDILIEKSGKELIDRYGKTIRKMLLVKQIKKNYEEIIYN